MLSMWGRPPGFRSSTSLLPRPASAHKAKRSSLRVKADSATRPTVADPQNEPDPSRLFLETQRRRSGKMAAKLQAFLGSFQNPALASKMTWVRSQQKQTEHKIPSCVMSKDDLAQLLKAEEADRFHLAERRARQLRAAVTIDDHAADELDVERRGTDAVQLTSDLDPAFAEALVRFGVLRHEVKEKAKERRAKADRLLSNMTSEIRHGHGLSKRKLKRGRSRGFDEGAEQVEEPEAPQEEADVDTEDVRDVMRQHRAQLVKPIAKFDKWMAGHLRRHGLARYKTAPAKMA